MFGVKLTGEKHWHYDRTIYIFEHKSTKEKFIGTRRDFYKEKKLDPAYVLSLVRKTAKNPRIWVCLGELS